MAKLIVVEARRLLPIAVLFLLLVAVSIYDGLTSPAAPVTALPNSVPYKTLLAAGQNSSMQSRVVTSLDMWVAMHEALGLELTDYEFDPHREVGVFFLNCQLRSTREVQGVVQLSVTAKKDTVQLVLFDKANLQGELDELQFVIVQD